MKVRAIKTGFYGALREVGDVFDVPDDLAASWFEALEQPGKPDEDKQPDKPKGKKDEGKPA